ncbi:MAG TPA: glycosyltransferase family 2 protein [Anaerovoracaceae bacterium]|nr:glycosyltransferase family 2 protein [Anaerovoracaceae bacterium]
MNSKKVVIIILNWNGWKDTIECLESVLAIDYTNYEVLVVDNGSKDGSIQFIKDWASTVSEEYSVDFAGNRHTTRLGFFEIDEKDVASIINGDIRPSSMSKKLTLIKNNRNYGFALGNNNAIKYALKTLPDYILLLNNDTVVDSAFLKNLVSLMDSDDRIGIVGPVNFSYFSPTTIIAVGENIDWKRGKTSISRSLPASSEGKISLEFDEVPGSCLLFRSKLIDDVGLMDPDYFCYYEETDWCVRAKQKGWIICTSLTSKILHKYGSTEKKIYGFKLYYLTRNRFWFMRKRASKLRFLVFLFFFLEDFTSTMLSLIVLSRDVRLMRIYFTAIYDGLR